MCRTAYSGSVDGGVHLASYICNTEVNEEEEAAVEEEQCGATVVKKNNTVRLDFHL